MKELMGHIAVDSGQVLITDPCYVLKNKKYKQACDLSLSTKQGGVLTVSGIAGNAVVTCTPTGDGLYPVYIERTKGKQIKRLIIELFPWPEKKDGTPQN